MSLEPLSEYTSFCCAYYFHQLSCSGSPFFSKFYQLNNSVKEQEPYTSARLTIWTTSLFCSLYKLQPSFRMVDQYSSEQLPNINGWQMGFKHKHLPALSYQSLLVFSSFQAAREIKTLKFLSTTGSWYNFCFTLHSR